MTTPPERAAPLPGGPVLAGAELLDRAVAYTRGALQLVAGADPAAATPCRGWDLEALLRHMDDSLAAFTEAAEIGYVDLAPVGDPWPDGPAPTERLVARLRGRACALVAAWSRHDDDHDVPQAIGVSPSRHRPELRSDLMAAAGALEITVHGWDVGRACGQDRPVPAGLALELLDVVPLFVQDVDRPSRFAEPVDVPLHARPSTRLLAAVGRRV
jgi:uncharacterized protein (TIGR03086 family)